MVTLEEHWPQAAAYITPEQHIGGESTTCCLSPKSSWYPISFSSSSLCPVSFPTYLLYSPTCVLPLSRISRRLLPSFVVPARLESRIIIVHDTRM